MPRGEKKDIRRSEEYLLLLQIGQCWKGLEEKGIHAPTCYVIYLFVAPDDRCVLTTSALSTS